jgi:hypothetical protein
MHYLLRVGMLCVVVWCVPPRGAARLVSVLRLGGRAVARGGRAELHAGVFVLVAAVASSAVPGRTINCGPPPSVPMQRWPSGWCLKLMSQLPRWEWKLPVCLCVCVCLCVRVCCCPKTLRDTLYPRFHRARQRARSSTSLESAPRRGASRRQHTTATATATHQAPRRCVRSCAGGSDGPRRGLGI